MRSIKQDRPTTHYIWRTRGDGKVRSAHAERDGQIFSWDDPPEGGHPGEDHNCRCTAEPHFPEVSEFVEIILRNVSDSGGGWRSRDFVEHYFNGNGRGVSVRETGHLSSIVSRYMSEVEEKLQNQISRQARRKRNGTFDDTFYNTYGMTGAVFSIGDTVIGGSFSGLVQEENGVLSLQGSLEFYLRDEFADPVDLGIEVDDYRPGSIGHDIGHGLSDIGEAIGDTTGNVGQTLYDSVHRPLDDYIRGRVGLKADVLMSRNQTSRKHARTGRDGVPYPITDDWSGEFTGQIYLDAAKSSYGQV